MQLLVDVKYRLNYTEVKGADEFWRNKFYIDIVVRQRDVAEYKKMFSDEDNLSAEEFLEEYRQ